MLRVEGSGCRVQDAGCRVQGSGCGVQGAGCRVQCLGFRVQGVGCRGGGGALHEQRAAEAESCRAESRPGPAYSPLFQPSNPKVNCAEGKVDSCTPCWV